MEMRAIWNFGHMFTVRNVFVWSMMILVVSSDGDYDCVETLAEVAKAPGKLWGGVHWQKRELYFLSIIPFDNHKFVNKRMFVFRPVLLQGNEIKKLSYNLFCVLSSNFILYIFPVSALCVYQSTSVWARKLWSRSVKNILLQKYILLGGGRVFVHPGKLFNFHTLNTVSCVLSLAFTAK